MKEKISAFILLIFLIFICTSGLIEPITEVFVWLITIDKSLPDVSVYCQLIAKYGAWIVTYALVGYIFSILGWFNGTVMKIVYFVISTIISFFLSWLIMAMKKYLFIIAIIIGIILLILVGAMIALLLIKTKKAKIEGEK